MQYFFNYKNKVSGQLFIFILLLLSPIMAQSSRITGATMEYENIGKDSFLVRVITYRNCMYKQAIAKPIYFSSQCGGSKVAAGGKFVNSTDITPFCAGVCNTCTDLNCSYGFGIQSATIESILDISKYNCCKFTFSWEESSFPFSITTGAAGQNFYTEVFLDKCVAGNHHSPKFAEDPVMLVQLNQCISRSQMAFGYEGDSLVYKLVDPLSAENSTIAYNEGYSKNAPLKYYGYPDIDKDFESPKCYGFHFDETTGELNFKPINEDVSVIAIEVEQWHKDSTGKYQKIGSSRRQNMITVADFSDNRTPILAEFISEEKAIYVCAGSSLDFKIFSFDVDSDSTKISWQTDIANASISSTNQKFPVTSFSWKPQEQDVRTQPYLLTVKANDGACPLPSSIENTYKIFVTPANQPNLSVAKNQLDCNTFNFQAKTDMSGTAKSYKWYVNNQLVSTDSVFTRAFLQPGKYAIRLAATGTCPTFYYDSVEIKAVPTVTNGRFRSVCFEDTILLQAENGHKYKWFSSEKIIGSDSDSAIYIKPVKAAFYYVEITDSQSNCIKRDSINVFVNYDCVWPGDANLDGIVNHLDMLEIGPAFGATGTPRSSDTSANWKPRRAFNWSETTYYGVDYKHLDANGDGKIDAKDTLAIARNYGKTRSTDFQQPEPVNADHFISFQFANDTFYAGETVNATLQTGNTDNNNLKVYGFAYNYSLVADKMVNGTLVYEQECIFCETSTGLEMLRKNTAFTGEAVQVRTDHLNQNINGTLANVSFVLKDASAGYNPNGEWIYLKLTETQAIDEYGVKYILNAVNDSAIVFASKKNIGIKENESIFGQVHIWPNPAKDQINLQSDKNITGEIYISNIFGQVVETIKLQNERSKTIDTKHFPPGIYMANFNTGNNRQQRIKFVIVK